MKTVVRWLKPGDVFILLRTGERFEYLHRDTNTPGGVTHWVRRVLEARHTTLHHSCHVEVITGEEK